MSGYFTESNYENAVLQLLNEDLGYTYVYGPDVERDYHSPLYVDVLLPSLQRINKNLPMDALTEAIYKLKNFETGTLLQKNMVFMDYLQNGVPVKYYDKGEERSTLVYLVDFKNPASNEFTVANQWTFIENSEKRPDVILFVNGLPLVIVELKSPSREETDASAAYRQLRNYMYEIPSMFIYNAVCVMSDLTTSKAGTITSGEDRFMEWKTTDGSYENTQHASFDTFFVGLFEKTRFLDIVKNFICFNVDGQNTFKILAGYHQYFAVKKAIESTKHATVTDGKGGVFWHTQGSGKSLSMVFYAHYLQEALESPTIVVITDRNDLDDQLYGQFARCKDFLRQEPVNAQSRNDLGRLLQGRQSGGVIFTTIQKFEEGDTPLSPRRNIIVMSDEAHRSQYGDEHWDAQSQRMKKGFSQKMREALPGASFIGFTGTPISDRDRDTEEVFGHYIDIYDMSQAVDDGATRPVYYESRVVNLRLDDDTMKLLNDEFDHLGDEGATEEQIRKAKQEHSRLEVLLGEDATIDTLTRDIVHHYEDNRAQELTGKAMIVALTRPIAIKIYRKILELRPGWTEKVKVVMSGSNQDPEDWQQIIGNEAYKKELARKFKDDDDPMKIAIVRDMWLTGFDVPSLATMYVYKPMSGHNLMQAIARVNRVFPGKEGGLIVDYVGIAQALKSAMQQYTNRDRHRFGDPDIAKTALLKWREEMEVCRDQLHGFDYTGFFAQDNTKRAAAITAGANYLSASALLQKKKDFMEHSALLHNATTLCRSLLDERQKTEVCYMDALRVMMLKLSQKGKISRHEINERIGDLLRQSVKTDGVINLFGDRQIEFSLFDEAFLQEVKNMKERNLAVELLTKLLKERIRQQKKTNITQSDLFSDMLSRSLSNYLKGLLTNEEVIQELLKMAQQMKHAEDEGNDLGLTSEEKAFYDALSTPEGVRQAYSDEEFVALTKELTEVLHTNRTIDWNRKESARAKMRVLVKRLLKKYKYPPEGAKKALETVMRQCDHWADDDENVL